MSTETAEIIGSVTERYQTTVPSYVRHALGVTPNCKLAWRVKGRQATVIVYDEGEEDDIAGKAWISFLERDIARGNVLPVTQQLMDRLTDLVAGVDIGDLDQPLDAEPDDE